MENYYFVIKYTVDNSMTKTKVYKAKDQSPVSYIERVKGFYDDDENVNILSVSLETL